jgi:hypothetical protein
MNADNKFYSIGFGILGIDGSESFLKCNLNSHTLLKHHDIFDFVYPATLRRVENILRDITSLKNVFEVSFDSFVQREMMIENGASSRQMIILQIRIKEENLLNGRFIKLTKTEKQSLKKLMAWLSDDWHCLSQKSSEELRQLCSFCSISQSRQSSHLKRKSNSDLGPLTFGQGQLVNRVSTMSQVFQRISQPMFNWKDIRRANDFGTASSSSELLNLPTENLDLILHYLDGFSLYLTSCTCKLIRRLSLGIIPGLRLRLFPHQYKSGILLLLIKTL